MSEEEEYNPEDKNQRKTSQTMNFGTSAGTSFIAPRADAYRTSKQRKDANKKTQYAAAGLTEQTSKTEAPGGLINTNAAKQARNQQMLRESKEKQEDEMAAIQEETKDAQPPAPVKLLTDLPETLQWFREHKGNGNNEQKPSATAMGELGWIVENNKIGKASSSSDPTTKWIAARHFKGLLPPGQCIFCGSTGNLHASHQCLLREASPATWFWAMEMGQKQADFFKDPVPLAKIEDPHEKIHDLLEQIVRLSVLKGITETGGTPNKIENNCNEVACAMLQCPEEEIKENLTKNVFREIRDIVKAIERQLDAGGDGQMQVDDEQIQTTAQPPETWHNSDAAKTRALTIDKSLTVVFLKGLANLYDFGDEVP